MLSLYLRNLLLILLCPARLENVIQTVGTISGSRYILPRHWVARSFKLFALPYIIITIIILPTIYRYVISPYNTNTD